MVGWVLFMCSRDMLTYIFFMKICSWTRVLLKIWGKKSQFSCAVYNVLKATFKMLEPFYHHIISSLHLKTCLTLEKYTEFDSQAAMKSADILGKRWPFPSSSGRAAGTLCEQNNPQKPGSSWARNLMDE